ncbi:capsule biosynthesis protein [Alteromonas aestuariivivens]|uniref:Capsule biosynthesis protein n=1 Tax=Alteromonas aestuariivivens TaxID=1938339 RepID=A0A3D8M3V9_9ALTE|nr:capsule biosynthesis protein [Alteromonas aestuariivivens]RDV24369.1 capsule biosynthesis protein [Alteromonas aestuariivivens]
MQDNYKKLIALFRRHSILVIAVPWLLYALYLILLASAQYESQSQLIIKSTESGSNFDPSSLLMSTVTGSAATSETHIIKAFVQSSDMLVYLNETLDLQAHYSSSNADIFSRLPKNATFEDFYLFYLEHVDISVDSTSSVITLKSVAFSPEMAQKINSTILSRSEAFINEINNNLAKSKLKFAQGEHDLVQEKLKDSKTQLLAFQSQYNVLDPTAEGAAFQQIALSLEATLAQKQAELQTMSSMMSDLAPDILNVKRQIRALKNQIEDQKAKINTSDNPEAALSVSELMAQYSNLKIQMELALQAYSSSLITLENARVDAYQQLQHLVTISAPQLPEENKYPQVGYNLTLFGVLLLMMYGIARIIIATIREL